MHKEKFLAIDLFSGAGGLTAGLKSAGFKVIAGVEINKTAAKSYKLNHRKHRMYEQDIRTLNPKDILTELGLKSGELDLLAGCPPCQGFSTLRTRNKRVSVEDIRNELIFEFLRFVEEMQPKTVMMENVPGLVKDTRMASFLDGLRKLGYIVDEHVLAVKDVSDYGVPQRRRRMILLASK